MKQKPLEKNGSEMKQELYDEMCRQCDVSPRIECIILELMHDAYNNGWEDGKNENEDSD